MNDELIIGEKGERKEDSKRRMCIFINPKGVLIVGIIITIFTLICGMLSKTNGMEKAMSFLIPMWGFWLFLIFWGKPRKKKIKDIED